MKMRWNMQLLVVAGGLLFAAGCGGEKPIGDIVKGTVTLDGQPLADGRISLAPTDNVGSTVGGAIKNGKFEVRIQPGPKSVEITSEKITGKQKAYPDDPKSPEFDIKEQILPAKYNSATELKADVKAGGPTEVSFTLESAKK